MINKTDEDKHTYYLSLFYLHFKLHFNENMKMITVMVALFHYKQ